MDGSSGVNGCVDGDVFLDVGVTIDNVFVVCGVCIFAGNVIIYC